MKSFKYFLDPLNFSHVSERPEKCSICSRIDICFTEYSFYGANKLKYVCDNCLILGKISDYKMSGNDVSDVDLKRLTGSAQEIKDKIDTILYRTPKLPTWQDIWWPVDIGDFCTFIKIASKIDFGGKDDLYKCVPEDDLYGNSANDLWERLADGPITNLKNGNYNTSFYLFKSNLNTIVLWDCN